jgi:hypothetical protein
LYRKLLLKFLASILLPIIIGMNSIGCSSSKMAASTIISFLEGDARIEKAGTISWVKAEVKAVLSENDVIKTGVNSKISITFFDGSIIDLNPNTQVEIRELVKGKTTSIRLKQEIGETLSKVEKLVDPASRYEIETPAAVAAVRGSTMLVEVVIDGTTTVANIDGSISVTARGEEVVIPKGKHSTVIPGETPSTPLEGTTSTIVSTPILTDTIGDWFDSQRRQVTGPEYLDIEFSQISFIDGEWIMKVGLRGALPAANAVTAKTLIEWDFLLDFDRDPATGLNRPFIGNDIGYDYLAQLSLENNIYKSALITVNKVVSETVDFFIHDNIVEIMIPMTSSLGAATISPPTFDWVVATIYYKDEDPRNQPSFTDKAPNEGHYVFP